MSDMIEWCNSNWHLVGEQFDCDDECEIMQIVPLDVLVIPAGQDVYRPVRDDERTNGLPANAYPLFLEPVGEPEWVVRVGEDT